MPGISRAIRPQVSFGFKWRKVFVLADFGLLLGAGPESSKGGLALGGCPIGEARNLPHETPHSGNSKPQRRPVGVLNWWWGGCPASNDY